MLEAAIFISARSSLYRRAMLFSDEIDNLYYSNINIFHAARGTLSAIIDV